MVRPKSMIGRASPVLASHSDASTNGQQQQRDVGEAVGIAVDGLSVNFAGGRSQSDTSVLDSLSLRVQPSEFLAVVGPSGCGKSTLLKVVAGLVTASAGTVAFGSGERSDEQRIGFLFQSDALPPWSTAIDTVALAVQLGGGERREAAGMARELMAELGLAEAGNRYPHQLSGGMRKRVALARTLAYQPNVFLLDEPFGALDALTRVTVGNFFLRVLERYRQTVMFVTHDIEEAVTLADRIVVMSASPSRIIDEIVVEIPRPRDYYESRFHPDAGALQHRIWDALGYGKHE